MSRDPMSEVRPHSESRPMLRQLAYDSFMESLSLGRIKPGQMVSQRELCELLSVHLGPMREALKRLEAEDVVRLIPQRGIEIVDVDERVIDEVYQLRRLIELEAIDAFARDLPEAEVRDLLERTERAVSGDAEESATTLEANRKLTDLDHAMHRMFVAGLGNRFAEEAHRRALSQLHLVRFYNRMKRLSGTTALEEHLGILRLLLDGAGKEARGLLSDHLNASQRRATGLD